MCTSPQNIYIPAAGVRVGDGDAAALVSFDEVAGRLAKAVDAIGNDPKKAAAILSTIQSPATLELLATMEGEARGRDALLLAPHAYVHPEFPEARTSTPLMLRVTPRGPRALRGGAVRSHLLRDPNP